MAIKFISIFLFSMVAGGCQSVSIGAIEKKIISAKRPGQSILMQYSTTIDVTETVTINAVEIAGVSDKLSLTIYRLPDGLTITNKNKLTPGKYYLSGTTLYRNELADTEEELLFYILDSSNKELMISKKSFLKKRI